jgi:hypothetical protein
VLHGADGAAIVPAVAIGQVVGVAVLSLCAGPAVTLAAQGEAPVETPKTGREVLVQRLRQLDLPYTDWPLLAFVREKIAADGAAAQPLIAVETEMARTSPDARYRVRLLGVQLAVEPDTAMRELQLVVTGRDEALAALAARVLGRCGAPPAKFEALVRDRLALESRSSVRGALVLAAGEAGVTALAPMLRLMLEKGAVPPAEVAWTWTALAQTADAEMASAARAWLSQQSPFLGTAVLLARRFRDPEAERPLVRMLEAGPPPPVAIWVVQSLGAVGGDAARRGLRAAIDADRKAHRDGDVVVGTSIDGRQLALLRLGDRDARAWVEGYVARSVTLLDAGVARVPELFGRWRVDGAAATLREWVRKGELPLLVRASAARGLCWLGEPYGIEAAADLLGEKVDALAPEVLEALRLLQWTLHDFVADPDRPDCRGLVPGDSKKAADIGKAWRLWLQQKGRVRWRIPAEDTENPWLWY